MQFINQPYQSLSPLHRMFAHYIDPPLPKVNNPRIDIVSFPTSFEGGKAVLPAPPKHRSKEVGWKEEVRPDLVVLCTGYRQDWSWLGEGYPRGPDECDIRGVSSSTDKSIAFIGFLRPGVGESTPSSSSPLSLLQPSPITIIRHSITLSG
jgi:dimethylaniline monooxygenase (N-oxide forming)